ncbi:hypothetical protein [Gimesia sp.]|uniref:hypothetical protein n=1 Tax=Gimesia sp. TaxID=2024833 RepID=UPI000C6746BC|nr:hypothetical protein [Gimesia sp.]MAX35816.1 hypothetical protein [Gimesia sp.]HAH48878.1 hypothetical protein [Planctomycetaceae bacterium]|tara:strand:+ start:6264 stop:6482 length:219 start_codon:yes stop_codon:yes gene_type:complete
MTVQELSPEQENALAMDLADATEAVEKLREKLPENFQNEFDAVVSHLVRASNEIVLYDGQCEGWIAGYNARS